jgi:hypothetical protein
VLNLIFWCLLGVNGVLFALGQGYLGTLRGGEREPARLLHQLHATQLSLISSATATAAQNDAASPGKLALKPPPVIKCIEIGNFTAADGARFETQLAALSLGERQSRHNVAGHVISSYMVFVEPQGSRENADKKVAELAQLGVANYFVMSDNSPMRWAISLGVFKSEAGAQNLLAALIKQGVRDIRIAPRMANSKQLAFQLRDLDTASKARLDQIKLAFPAQEMHRCE